MSSILPIAFYAPDAVQTNLTIAGEAFKSGLLPAFIRSPQAALYVMQRGGSLGLDPFFALENTYLINGKLFLGIHAAQALLASKGIKWEVIESTANKAEVLIMREGWKTKSEVFTAEDAKRAKLDAKDSYRNYPADILYANAFRKAARKWCADLLMGLNMIDEIEIEPRGTTTIVESAPVALEPEKQPRKPRQPKVAQAVTVDTEVHAEPIPETQADPEVTYDNASYHKSNEEQEPVEGAARKVVMFDWSSLEHRALLSKVCDDLRLSAKWRVANQTKVRQLLSTCEATELAISAMLQEMSHE